MFNAAQSVAFGQAIADPMLPWLYAGMVCVLAGVVVVSTGPELLSCKHHKQEESAEEPVVATVAPRVT